MFFIDIAVPRDVEAAVNQIEGIFVYDIDDLQQVAAAHLEERGRQAGDAETLIAAEVERFHQRRRTVNVAPAIVSLQHQAEEMRLAELKRMHAKLGSLSDEQLAAVEALTRGLVNKFLHAPMQALKQAARENDATRVEALCDAWSLPVVADHPSNLTEITSAPVVSTAGSEESERAEVRENQASVVGGK